MGSNVVTRSLKGTAIQQIWPGYAGARSRTVNDGVTTNTSPTVQSATAAFDSNDVGRTVAGTGIPATTISSIPATTIAVGSNGAALPQGTINVASTTGFATSGTITVVTSTGTQTVAYTGTTGTTFTGCTGGTGTMSTGGVVTTTTQAVMSANATATATGVTLTLSKSLPVNPPGASSPGAATYYGFTIRETTGSAGATVVLRDGSATGDILEEITLVGGQSADDWYGPQGIRLQTGMIYASVLNGAVEGSVRVS